MVIRRFWRGILIFCFGGVLGTAFGVALGFFLFPFVFPPPEADEQLTAADVAPVVAAAPPAAVSPPVAAPPVAPVPSAGTPPAGAPDRPPQPVPPSAGDAPAVTPQIAAAPPQPVPPPSPPKPVATGTFIHANPSDPVHWGRGRVSAYERTVFLESDFEVGPGPKYHVYLVPKASVRKEADVNNAMFVDLGRLRAFKGSQRYPIPAGVNLKDYRSVVIWCERFGVLISPADLKATN
jgi:hypothetical protein